MSLLALTLVLLSAFLHASWNLLAKRVSSGAEFVWLFALCSIVLFTPAGIYILVTQRPHFGWAEAAVILASGALHVGYMLALQRGYRVGDLSLVYPLARGTGPALSVVGAILLFGERPGVIALLGVGLVVTGAFLLAGGERMFRSVDGPALFYGLLTGLFIASYTLTDAYAVQALALSPVLLLWGSEAFRVVALAPVTVKRWPHVRTLWRERWREIVAVSVLSPAAYLLVLFALRLAPVSYVAPAREISILIGAALGAGLLREGEVRRRLAAAAVMVLGVYALSIAPI